MENIDLYWGWDCSLNKFDRDDFGDGEKALVIVMNKNKYKKIDWGLVNDFRGRWEGNWIFYKRSWWCYWIYLELHDLKKIEMREEYFNCN